jgi:hypothetical protein
MAGAVVGGDQRGTELEGLGRAHGVRPEHSLRSVSRERERAHLGPTSGEQIQAARGMRYVSVAHRSRAVPTFPPRSPILVVLERS